MWLFEILPDVRRHEIDVQHLLEPVGRGQERLVGERRRGQLQAHGEARFAQPGRYPRQHADHRYPSDQFPFAYPVTTDPLTGVTDGILKRPDTDPLVLHTQTSSEYWERRGSLVHADALGRDVADHERARVYLFSCSQHSADPLLGPQRGPHQGQPRRARYQSARYGGCGGFLRLHCGDVEAVKP